MTSQGAPRAAAEAHPHSRLPARVGVPQPAESPVPPASNTGAHLSFHWLRGGFGSPVGEAVALASELTSGGHAESHDWGRYFYRRHHEFVAGLRIYYDPAASNMPAVMVDAPGEACEFLGLESLRTLFCNAELARADLKLDGAPFTPSEMADEVRRGNIRCKSQLRHYAEDLGKDSGGNTLSLGSRSSDRVCRIYDGRGFTRVEVELKGRYARAAKVVLLAEPEGIPALVVGVLRDFVDFVDTTRDENVSRAPLLPKWEAFAAGSRRVRLAMAGNAAPKAERVKRYVEHHEPPWV